MNRLPEKLATLRKHYKYSQEHLAQVLDIDVTDYMGIENGRRVLNHRQIVRLTKFYRIDFDELFINDKEVTLHNYVDTTTDQINIEYFLKQNRWYKRLFRKIANSKIIQILLCLCLVILLIVLFKHISNINKPLVFMTDDSSLLSVSEKTVSYINKEGRLQTTGALSTYSDDHIVEVTSGENFVLVLREDGQIDSFGLNEDKTNEVSKLKDIVYITACDNHIIAIDKLGNIKTIGDNEYGELDILKWKDIRNIKTFKTGTIGIDEKGYLVYAGNIVGRSQFNQYKNCLDYDCNEYMTVVIKNDNTVDYSAYNDHYAGVVGWKDIIDVCCGNDFIAGLRNDGKVLINSLDEELVEEVSKWENIIAIASSDDYIIGFDSEKIFGAGKNTYDQFEKEEKIIYNLPQINANTLKVDVYNDKIDVTFEPVENAYGYKVSLNVGTIITYEVRPFEKVSFVNLELEEGKYYTIKITSLGSGDYISSSPFEYIFEFKKVEEQNEQDVDSNK